MVEILLRPEARTATAAPAMYTVTRTPLRVSLFGGGTDYPEWFSRRPGAVIGFTIDKYVYLSALRLSAFVDYRYRLSYSRLETVLGLDDIEHPVVRAVLRESGFEEPLDCSIQADLPASAGLGSSSAFTVGLLNLVSALQGARRSRLELALLAIDTEQRLLGERVGVQDQLHAAFGGLNRFNFHGDKLSIEPVQIADSDLDDLTSWMVLVFTGLRRHASDVLEEQLQRTAGGGIDRELEETAALVDGAQAALQGLRRESLALEVSRLLREAWRLKRSFSTAVTNPEIDALYEACCREGAIAGKLCGAGGGGFLLLIVPPERRDALVRAMGAERCVSFRVDYSGSTVQQRW